MGRGAVGHGAPSPHRRTPKVRPMGAAPCTVVASGGGAALHGTCGAAAPMRVRWPTRSGSAAVAQTCGLARSDCGRTCGHGSAGHGSAALARWRPARMSSAPGRFRPRASSPAARPAGHIPSYTRLGSAQLPAAGTRPPYRHGYAEGAGRTAAARADMATRMRCCSHRLAARAARQPHVRTWLHRQVAGRRRVRRPTRSFTRSPDARLGTARHARARQVRAAHLPACPPSPAGSHRRAAHVRT